MGTITTVAGPVEPALLGFTLPHEHIYISLGYQEQRFDYVDQLDDDHVVADELMAFRAQGGTCIVDATLPEIGRDPVRLRAISERTGLAVVMSCGWYRAPYYPKQDLIERRPVRDLAAQLVREIEDGVGGTGIKPGLIGEIGVQAGWVEPIEERVHRAVARAQRATGLPILTHSLLRDVGLEQLAIFEEEGVDPARVVIGHCDMYPRLEYYLRIIERGASLALDNLGIDSWGRHEERLAGLVRELVERGYEDRILLSQDICKVPHFTFHGGPGYVYVHDGFLPRLRALGIAEETLTRITSDNPRRWLTIATEGQARPE